MYAIVLSHSLHHDKLQVYQSIESFQTYLELSSSFFVMRKVHPLQWQHFLDKQGL